MSYNKIVDEISKEYDRKIFRIFVGVPLFFMGVLVLISVVNTVFEYNAQTDGTRVSVKVIERNAEGTKNGMQYSTLFEDDNGNRFLVEGKDAYTTRDNDMMILYKGNLYVQR